MTKRILAVEDDADILFMIEHILRDEGFEMFSSIDGMDILKVVEEVRPDLILMDVRLPTFDGRDLCQIIRAKNHIVPIILMSAHLDYAWGYNRTLVNDFIPKPFDIFEFVRRIQKQLAA